MAAVFIKNAGHVVAAPNKASPLALDVGSCSTVSRHQIRLNPQPTSQLAMLDHTSTKQTIQIYSSCVFCSFCQVRVEGIIWLLIDFLQVLNESLIYGGQTFLKNP